MRNLLLVAGGLVIGLLLGETGLRVFSPTYPSVYQPDSTLLYRLVPSSRKVFLRDPANGGQRVVVKINSLGFRGDELRPRAPGKRIAVYGDSFMRRSFPRSRTPSRSDWGASSTEVATASRSSMREW